MTALQTADSSATGSGTGWGAPAPQTPVGGLPPPKPPAWGLGGGRHPQNEVLWILCFRSRAGDQWFLGSNPPPKNPREKVGGFAPHLFPWASGRAGAGNKHKIQRTSGSAQPSCAQAQRKIGRIRHEPAPNLPIFEGRASPGTSLGKRGQGTKTETGLKYSGGINNEAGIFERAPGRPRSCQRIVNFGPLSSQTGSHEPGESAQLGSQLGLDEFSDS
jgi:hypothetical protein